MFDLKISKMLYKSELSNEEISEKTGITTATVHNLKNLKKSCNSSTLKKFFENKIITEEELEDLLVHKALKFFPESITSKICALSGKCNKKLTYYDLTNKNKEDIFIEIFKNKTDDEIYDLLEKRNKKRT